MSSDQDGLPKNRYTTGARYGLTGTVVPASKRNSGGLSSAWDPNRPPHRRTLVTLDEGDASSVYELDLALLTPQKAAAAHAEAKAAIDPDSIDEDADLSEQIAIAAIRIAAEKYGVGRLIRGKRALVDAERRCSAAPGLTKDLPERLVANQAPVEPIAKIGRVVERGQMAVPLPEIRPGLYEAAGRTPPPPPPVRAPGPVLTPAQEPAGPPIPERKIYLQFEFGDMETHYHDLVRSGNVLVAISDTRHPGTPFRPKLPPGQNFVGVVGESGVALVLSVAMPPYKIGDLLHQVWTIHREIDLDDPHAVATYADAATIPSRNDDLDASEDDDDGYDDAFEAFAHDLGLDEDDDDA